MDADIKWNALVDGEEALTDSANPEIGAALKENSGGAGKFEPLRVPAAFKAHMYIPAIIARSQTGSGTQTFHPAVMPKVSDIC